MSGQVYSEPFAQIPEWLIDSDVSDRAIRAFLVLHRHANKEGYAFPGRAAIAERLGCSPASLDRALNELREVGAIVSRQRKDGNAVIGNDYWLWPAHPSSPVRSPSLTPEATPSLTHAPGATSPTRQQEEREPSNESQKTSGASGAVEEVFAAFQEATGKTRAKLTDDRRGRIVRWLRVYSAEDLCDAVRGWRWSPHHCGHNDRGTVYNDLELLLRDAKHIEQFRDWERGLHRPQPRAQQSARMARSSANAERIARAAGLTIIPGQPEAMP